MLLTGNNLEIERENSFMKELSRMIGGVLILLYRKLKL
jgi:hypothetical protein